VNALWQGENHVEFTDPGAINRSKYPGEYITTDRVSVTSADGAVLPVFLTRRRDLPLEGEAKVPLHRYGGLGGRTTPAFQPVAGPAS